MECSYEGENSWAFRFSAAEVQAVRDGSGIVSLMSETMPQSPPAAVLEHIGGMLCTIPDQCKKSLIDQYVDEVALIECSPEELRELGLTHEEVMSWPQSRWHQLQSLVVLDELYVSLAFDAGSPGGVKSVFYNATVIDPWRRCWDVGDGYIDGYIQL